MLDEMLKASLLHTPIGPLPENFNRLSDLCRAASIRYQDETIQREEKKVIMRRWLIVPDDKPAIDSKGSFCGSASTKFHKFCMILDYLEDQNPAWTRAMILQEAIDQRDPNCKKLMATSWRQMNDNLAKMGIRNYMILKGKKSNDRDLPDF